MIGQDKAWGANEASERLGQPAWTFVFSGDNFGPGGNDLPAVQQVGISINVKGNIEGEESGAQSKAESKKYKATLLIRKKALRG